jgi:hypothetical protein
MKPVFPLPEHSQGKVHFSWSQKLHGNLFYLLKSDAAFNGFAKIKNIIRQNQKDAGLVAIPILRADNWKANDNTPPSHFQFTRFSALP